MKFKSLRWMILFVMAFLLAAPLGISTQTAEAAPASTGVWHTWVPFESAINNYGVQAIYADGSDLYVGGQFTNIGGVPGATGIARWDGSAWHALDTGLDGSPSSIVRVGSWLYAGGSFLNAGGDANADNIARWDGSAWSSVGGNQLNSMVFTLTTDGSNLYVGGQFTNAAGIPEGDNVAVWNGTTWAALGNGLLSPVRSLAFFNGQLHAGGSWPFLSRFDGVAWNTIPGISTGYDISLVPIGSDLYVGGEFTNAGGIEEADHVARWDGSNWHALGSGLNGDLYAMIAYGSELIVSGNFTDAGSDVNADVVARWDGSTWHNMRAGMTGYIGDFAWLGNDLYAGGYFEDAHGDPLQDNLIIWKEAQMAFMPVAISP
jgi:hypothetical protein